jgi:outer membrane protein OmpA-like peptidoglycan-associated protein
MRQLLLCLFAFLQLATTAQEFKVDDFRLSGEAIRTGSNCIRLTPDRTWSSGSIWHKKPISLRTAFEATIEFMLGCKDEEGADGLVFVFHPHAEQLGYQGEGMGFSGLNPSLGIELDTWLNEHLADPGEDHVALLKNGSVHHHTNIIGPVSVSNLEDCRRHTLAIKWSPKNNHLKILLDGTQLIQYNKNIRQEIFSGIDEIYWGLTAATGAYSNRQEICFKELKYTLSEDLPPIEMYTKKEDLLEGKPVILSNIQFKTGSSTLLPMAKTELAAMANILKKNKDKRLDIFGHTDDVGSPETNLKLSGKRANVIALYLEALGVDPKQLNPRGYGEEYPITGNTTSSGRSKNRRIEFRLLTYYP